MGTNYYWYEKPPCEVCGHSDEPLHIGKSSAGWCFGLHIIPEGGINDLGDWERLFSKEGSYIQNEYGDKITPKEMLNIITDRSWPGNHDNFDYHANYAEPGPNNMVRCRIEGSCVKHGAGTWDCITGEFS